MRLQPFLCLSIGSFWCFEVVFACFSAWFGVFTIFGKFPFVLSFYLEWNFEQILAFSCVHLYVFWLFYISLYCYPWSQKSRGLDRFYCSKYRIFSVKAPTTGLAWKMQILTRNETRQNVLLFSLNLTLLRTSMAFLWLLACCNGFMVLGCALWLSVLAFFDFQMLCYLTWPLWGHNPQG